MSVFISKLCALSLIVLTLFELSACATQSYYSSYLSYPKSVNAYRRADYTPYRDNNQDYYDALKQRRMRALAESYQGNSNAQSYYTSSRLPAASTSTQSDNSASNSKRDNNNYNRYALYASNNNQVAVNAAESASASRQQQSTATTTTQRPRASKADEQNAKFLGIRNQEANDEDTPKSFGHLKRKKRRRCLVFGRDAQGNEVTPPPKEQGRLLWDLNVYNIYSAPPPIYGGSGCGGGGAFAGASSFGGFGGPGGFGGGGLFSDPIEDAYAPPNRLNNFLQLFAPGILQNALAATARPQAFRPQSDTGSGLANDVDPDVDANAVAARPPAPVRRPNRVYYDSAGAAPVTPAQLVGGVATTVNGIIQQLTGNVQPVYPGYRSLSYGK